MNDSTPRCSPSNHHTTDHHRRNFIVLLGWRKNKKSWPVWLGDVDAPRTDVVRPSPRRKHYIFVALIGRRAAGRRGGGGLDARRRARLAPWSSASSSSSSSGGGAKVKRPPAPPKRHHRGGMEEHGRSGPGSSSRVLKYTKASSSPIARTATSKCMNATTALVRNPLPMYPVSVIIIIIGFRASHMPSFFWTWFPDPSSPIHASTPKRPCCTLLIPYARKGDHNVVAEESAECWGGGSSSGVVSAFRIHTHRARAGGRSPLVSLVPHEDCTGAVVVVFFRRRTGYIFLRERTRTLL